MKVILMMHLNQFVQKLYKTYKNHLGKLWGGLLIQF